MCKQECSPDLDSNRNSCFLFGFEYSLSCSAKQRWQRCASAGATAVEIQLWTCLTRAKMVDILWIMGCLLSILSLPPPRQCREM